MVIKTSRAFTNADVKINYDKCTSCGLCARVCKSVLYMENGVVKIDQENFPGCVGCGQCAAVCPVGCITVDGRDISPSDIIEMPRLESRATFEQLKSLMISRRSVRDFTDREIDRNMIEEIIDAASTAPMGVPPSDVSILVLNGRKKVQTFVGDIIENLKSMKWMFSPFMLALWRPFIGKVNFEMFKSFIIPLIDAIQSEHARGEDILLYKAPLAIYFYASPFGGTIDPIIAATHAMLAAESLGLGTCMIGMISQPLKGNKKLQKKYGIPSKHSPGIMVIFGYPAMKYKRAIKRRFARVNYY